MTRPTVLLTGATGTVGAALCDSLADRGCELNALARGPATTVGGVVVLMLMHAVVAAASVGCLTRGVGLR